MCPYGDKRHGTERRTTMTIDGKNIAPSSDGKLRIAVSPRALFDMSRENELFENDGSDTYRKYQLAHLDQPYGKGVAYNFIERVLRFNAIGEDTGTKGHGSLVEVIVMSHMDPSTGVRVMRTINHYGLDVYQSVFSSGSSLTPFIASMGVSLYLSTDEDSVREALDAGFPSGRVMGPITSHDDPDGEVRIAFDFDGVLADDSSEHRFATDGLAGFCDHERRHAFEPMRPGPLLPFLQSLGNIQHAESAYMSEHPDYRKRLKIAICTARGMPSDVRVIKSLEHWGINVDIACFRDGCEKAPFLRGFDASLFFDDQLRHIDAVEQYVPSVHVPFGVRNGDAENGTASRASDANIDNDNDNTAPCTPAGDDTSDELDGLCRKWCRTFIPRVEPDTPCETAIESNRRNDKVSDETGGARVLINLEDERLNAPTGSCGSPDATEDGYIDIPDSDGDWHICLDPKSDDFGKFRKADGDVDANLKIRSDFPLNSAIYIARNGYGIPCYSIDMIGSAITADIDSDYGPDKAVRTLEFEIGAAEFINAQIAFCKGIDEFCESIGAKTVLLEYTPCPNPDHLGIGKVSFRTTAIFDEKLGGAALEGVRIAIAERNVRKYREIEAITESAHSPVYALEASGGFEIAETIMKCLYKEYRR